MNETTPHNMWRNSITFRLPSMEEGVRNVEKILTKDLLCWHDVEQIKKIYNEIVIEGELAHRLDVLQKINNKIDLNFNLVVGNVTKIKSLISLYHLQNAPEQKIEARFKREKENLLMSWYTLQDIATYLPACESEERFQKDVEFWFGSNTNSEIAEILQLKREEFQNELGIAEVIGSKRKTLSLLRKEAKLGLYPAYLDEIIDDGYVHLYDYLVRKIDLSSPERRKSINENLFSLVSHVVLETREAIIRKVKKIVPAACQNVLFLIGGSGAGKSTTLCFLRGDKMELKENNYYSKNDASTLIGHSSTISCTLLPNVAVVNDWFIVDFPGFHDSNGPIITLGIECALKALVKEYTPKILVLESITNIDNKFAAPQALGERLNRLVGKESCTLGITKYSMDSNFQKITSIEEEQRKERSQRSEEEIGLIANINELSSLRLDSLKSRIEEKQKRLGEIQKDRERQMMLPFPETRAKKELRKKIQDTEKNLLEHIGLGSIIRFDNFKDNSPSSYLAAFSQKKPVIINPEHSLDPEQQTLLKSVFLNGLVKRIEAIDFHKNGFNIVEDFKKIIKDENSSLIKVLLSQLHPEVVEFLHLPEIDPRILRDYDKQIVDNSIQKCAEFVISSRDMEHVKNKIAQIEKKETNKSEIDELKKKFSALQKCALELKIDLQKNNVDLPQTNKKRESEDPSSSWTKFLKNLLSSISLLLEEYEEKKEEQRVIRDLSLTLNEIYEVLQKLKDLKIYIKEKDKILESVKGDGMQLENSDEVFKKDREIVLSAVKQNGLAIQHAAMCFREDENIILIAVKGMGDAFQYAAENLKKNKLFVLKIVSLDYHAFQHAHPNLKGEKKFVLGVVKQNGLTLRYLSKSLKKDKEVILSALNQNGLALEFVDENLCTIKEYVLPAVRQNYRAVRYVKDEILKDEIILEFIKFNIDVLQYGSKNLKGDEKFLLNLVERKSEVFRYATETLRKNKDFILQIVKRNYHAFQYVSHELRNSQDFILEVVKINGHVFQYAGKSLRKNKDFVLCVIEICPYASKYADKSLRKDEEILSIKRSRNYEKGPEVLQDQRVLPNVEGSFKDKEAALAEVRNNGYSLKYYKNFQGNRDVVLAAVIQAGDALQYASEHLQGDEDIVLQAVKQTGSALQYADKKIKKNENIVFVAVEKEGFVLQYAGKSCRANKKIVLAAVQNEGLAFIYADESLKRDPDILAVAKKNGWEESEFFDESINIKIALETLIGSVEERMIEKKYRTSLPGIGLKNIGNSCYINAVLQALFAVPELCKEIQKAQKEPFLCSLKKLNEGDRSSVTLASLREDLFSQKGKGMLIGGEYAQQDAHEFLVFVLDILNWNHMKTQSCFLIEKEGIEHFGDLQTTNHLSVGFLADSLQKIIENYTRFEEIEGSVSLEVNGKTRDYTGVKHGIKIVEYPSILFIHLKRFSVVDMKTQKIEKEVSFPLDDFVLNKEAKYEVLGCINHHQKTIESGHYTADIRKEGRWVHYDDEFVSEIPSYEVGKEAYIIMLRKKE